MGILDKLRSRSKGALDSAKDKHGDKAAEGVEKAGQFIDEKTGGKYHDKIDKGVEK
ncbi:MAG: antitoxin [Propionibacteriales bacterium]|nr:antitoxin [Propionibacteriales bacterium]